jgi:hypothetical protein
MTHDMLIQLINWMGLILASPMLYRMSYLLVMQIGRAIWKTKEVTIQHVHDGRMVSSFTLKLDSSDPIVMQLEAIKHRRTPLPMGGKQRK